MLRVFIGYDPRQPLAYTVAAHSLVTTSSVPVSVMPLMLHSMPVRRRGLTEFTYSRYLVPHLCGYEGRAFFVDADVLFLGDVAGLPWDHDDSVRIVPHDGQLKFERPAVMLFNNAKCRKLTPEYVETGTPQSFEWAESVGNLPQEWNHLVGYDTPKQAKLVHFTMGIPCWPETENCEYADEWRAAASHCMSTVTWKELMGNSVHAAKTRTEQSAFAGAMSTGRVQSLRR